MTHPLESWKTGSPIQRYRNPGEGYGIAALILGLFFFPIGIFLAVKSRRISEEAEFYPTKIANIAFWFSIIWGAIWLVGLVSTIFHILFNY